MMPKDKLPTKSFGDMEAYLAEGRSIGGLSGSPVFVRSTVKMPEQTAEGKLGYISGLGAFHLLGLMHGHWDLPVSFSSSEQAEAVNMGVSIVVPAKKIWRLSITLNSLRCGRNIATTKKRQTGRLPTALSVKGMESVNHGRRGERAVK